MVIKMLQDVCSTYTSIASAKVNFYQNNRSDFNKAMEFMSGVISSIHAAAQLDYVNQHSRNKRQYAGLNDHRSGRNASVVAAAVGKGDEMAADVDVPMNARHSQTRRFRLQMGSS